LYRPASFYYSLDSLAPVAELKLHSSPPSTAPATSLIQNHPGTRFEVSIIDFFVLHSSSHGGSK